MATVIIGLREVIASLTVAESRLIPEVSAILGKGALNIKTSAKRRVSGLPKGYAPAYPASISYDVFTDFGSLKAEIGPDKERAQGALGNLIELGSINNAPIPHLSPALDEEAPRFEAALATVLPRLLS